MMEQYINKHNSLFAFEDIIFSHHVMSHKMKYEM